MEHLVVANIFVGLFIRFNNHYFGIREKIVSGY
jgi:hypothetical protein